MKNKVLSVAQLRALSAVNKFVEENGFPPTIAEIRVALELASDQSVIEALGRLERAGFLTRDSRSARSIRLTNEGKGQLAPETPNAKIDMTSRQKEVHTRLNEFDKSIGRMYLGALMMLEREENPDFIAQAAHSIREIVMHLPEVESSPISSDELEVAKKQRRANSLKLNKFFDPLGGNTHLESNLYDIWNRQHKYFIDVAHHRKIPLLDEFRAKLEEYENFLLQYVFPPQYHAYEQVDTVLRAGPDTVTGNELRSLVTRNRETYSYFFRTADDSWIEKLKSNNFLVADHEVAGYLARIAQQKPKEVFEAINKLKLADADWITVGKLVSAASQLTPKMISSFTDLIIRARWLKSKQAEMNSHSIVEFLDALLARHLYSEALSLTDEILAVQQKDADATACVKDYQYEQALESLRKIPADEIAPFIRLVVQRLYSVMLIEHPNRDTEDASYIWHPAIENHGQNWNRDGIRSLLIVALRDMLQTYFSGKKEAGKTGWQTELPELLKTEIAFAVFDRIKIHIYRIFKEDFGDAIEGVLFAKLGDTYVWHEYALLADESFPQFDSATRSKYLAAIEKGPEDKGRDAQYKKYWITRQLKLIRNHLTEDEKKRLSKFDIFTDGEFEDDPTFLSAMRSFHGPTSAYNKGDLENLAVSECIKILIDWKPTTEHFAPSREGLGRIFEEIVVERAEDFSSSCVPAWIDELHPTYITHYFRGLTNVIRNQLRGNGTGVDAKIAWEPVIRLAQEVIARGRMNTLPIVVQDEDDRWGEGWRDVMQEIARFLDDALNQQKDPVPLSLMSAIWECIDYLCEHPDPSPEREAEEKSFDPYTLSINCVRGEAFHALFAFIYWHDRLHEKSRQPNNRIVQEAKNKLQEYFARPEKYNVVSHTVCGANFRWMIVYDTSLAEEIKDKLFEDTRNGEAAWMAYLLRGLSTQSFAMLQLQYGNAIENLSRQTSEENHRRGLDPVQNLIGHIAAVYAYQWDGAETLLKKFLSTASPEQRGQLWSEIGRTFVIREYKKDDKRPSVAALENIWEARLRDAQDPMELKEFGWWIKEGYFDDQWMLERLNETLKKTKGELEGQPFVMDALELLTTKYPLPCIKALELLITCRGQEYYFYHGHEKEKKAILIAAYQSKDSSAIKIADKVVDHLTKRGFEQYRRLRGTESESRP